MKLLNKHYKKNFISELELLINLNHPKIVQFIGIYLEGNYFSIVSQYMKNKSLKDVLETKSIKLKESQLISFCLESAIGIWYMHSRNPPVLHRDLKSSNCLIDENFKLKLCDFGLSKVFNDECKRTHSKSNPYWMSPESLLEGIYTEKSDIYSLGIMFWEIMHRDTIPYKKINETCFYFEENLKILRPKIEDSVNKKMSELIQKCWQFESHLRPSINEVYIHLNEIYNDSIQKESKEYKPPREKSNFKNREVTNIYNISGSSNINITRIENLNSISNNSSEKNLYIVNSVLNSSRLNNSNNVSIISHSIGNINTLEKEDN